MSSVAVVVLDTLRKDYFDDHFGWLPGLRFDAAYSTSNWTGPAHASLFTGKYGSAVNVSSKSIALDCDRPVLAETLSDAGFKTKGLSANPNAGQRQQFDRGFDEFSGPSELKSGNYNILDTSEFAADHDELPRFWKYLLAVNEIVTGDYDTLPSLWASYKKIRGSGWRPIPDDGASVVRQRVREMDVGSDEFLFVNLVEAHTPYFPPEAYREFKDPVEMEFGEAYLGVDDPELTRNGYDSAVRYLSDIYRDIFESLSAKYDYVITLSDHGELLGDHHGMWNHVSGIYPELTHIPLVISGSEFDGTSETVVSILDLYDTILDLADVSGLNSDGRSIIPPNTDNARYLAEYRGPFKHSLEKSKEYEFDLEQYDQNFFALIESGYYGYEDYDGWRETGDCDHESPKELLHECVAEHEMQQTEDESVELTEGAKSRLEKLGYI